MILENLVDDCIHKLRPLIKSGITKLWCSPVLDSIGVYKIEYNPEGMRRVYIRDLSVWKEHKFIDMTLEDTLANSGYHIIQPVSRLPLKNCVVTCDAVRLKASNVLLATSMTSTKFTGMNPTSPDTLGMLPPTCLSIHPYFIQADFTGLKPSQAKSYIASLYQDIVSIMEQSSPPRVYSSNPDQSFSKLVSVYPSISGSVVKGLSFQRDTTEI